tara:strand:- start:832 stop:1368 length:537 start_codon:yes stop_codon:yes gene_type:complete
MPDLKSEMSKVLDAWEQDDQQTQQPQEKQVQNTLPQIFKPTNNVSRETFNYIRDNPNKNSKEIRTTLTKQGFNAGSVGSLITQFLKQGQVSKDANGRYNTIVPEYTPLKSTKQFRSEGKRVNKIVQIKSKTQGAGIAALKVDTTPKVKPSWDVDTVLDTMSIVQARALYDALKKIFGG